jgi:predicted lipid-binding transport protein (Tim44 family)
MQPRPSLTLRKPSTASPEAVAAFVAGDDTKSEPAASASPTVAAVTSPSSPPLRSVPPSAPLAAEPPITSRRTDVPSFRRASRAIVERRTRPARRRTTVYLDVDVATELAQALAHRDQELSDAVNSAVRAWLDNIR